MKDYSFERPYIGDISQLFDVKEYRLVGGKPLRFSKADDKIAATQLLNDRLGEAIRKYPEQYLWAHRRWRHD